MANAMQINSIRFIDDDSIVIGGADLRACLLPIVDASPPSTISIAPDAVNVKCVDFLGLGSNGMFENEMKSAHNIPVYAGTQSGVVFYYDYLRSTSKSFQYVRSFQPKGLIRVCNDIAQNPLPSSTLVACAFEKAPKNGGAMIIDISKTQTKTATSTSTSTWRGANAFGLYEKQSHVTDVYREYCVESGAKSVAWLDNSTFAAGMSLKTLNLFDIRAPVTSIVAAHVQGIAGIRVNTFARQYFATFSDGDDCLVKIWDARSFTAPVYSFSVYSSRGTVIGDVQWSLTNKHSILSSICKDNNSDYVVQLHDLTDKLEINGAKSNSVNVHRCNSGVHSIGCHHKERKLTVLGCSDGTIEIVREKTAPAFCWRGLGGLTVDFERNIQNFSISSRLFDEMSCKMSFDPLLDVLHRHPMASEEVWRWLSRAASDCYEICNDYGIEVASPITDKNRDNYYKNCITYLSKLVHEDDDTIAASLYRHAAPYGCGVLYCLGMSPMSDNARPPAFQGLGVPEDVSKYALSDISADCTLTASHTMATVAVTTSGCMCKHHISLERLCALRNIGWKWYLSVESQNTEISNEIIRGNHTRAAFITAMTQNIEKSLGILKQSDVASSLLLSLPSPSPPSLRTNTSLDAYCLAIAWITSGCVMSDDMFLCKCSRTFHGCTCRLLPYRDRIGLALVTLDVNSLSTVMTMMLRQSIEYGIIDGVILTGLPTPWCVIKTHDEHLGVLHNTVRARLSDASMSIVRNSSINNDDLLGSTLIGMHLFAVINARLYFATTISMASTALSYASPRVRDGGCDVGIVALTKTADSRVSPRVFSVIKWNSSGRFEISELYGNLAITPPYPSLLLMLAASRNLLNSNSLFHARANIDVGIRWSKYLDSLGLQQSDSDGIGSCVPNTDSLLYLSYIQDSTKAVRISCPNCSKPITPIKGIEIVLDPFWNKIKGASAGYNPGRSKAADRYQANNVCECSRSFPSCCICLHRLSYTEVTRFDPSWSCVDSWYCWCEECNHGGHYNHVLQWFSKHEICAVPGCDCCCRINK